MACDTVKFFKSETKDNGETLYINSVRLICLMFFDKPITTIISG